MKKYDPALTRMPSCGIPNDQERIPAVKMTPAKTGSIQKIRVLRARAFLGQELFHPDDEKTTITNPEKDLVTLWCQAQSRKMKAKAKRARQRLEQKKAAIAKFS